MDWNSLFFSFEGRIGRTSFWIGSLILGFIHWASTAVAYGAAGQTVAGIVGSIVVLVTLYSSFAIAAKRWHDHGKSGWWTLIVLIPFFGVLYYLVVCGFMRGTEGPNRFGSDPLADAMPRAAGGATA